jgi:hypothetical protein
MSELNYNRIFNLQACDQKGNKILRSSYYVDASSFSEAQAIANLIKLDESAQGHKREFKITSLDLSNLPRLGQKGKLYEVFENFYSGCYLVDRKVRGIYLATDETITSIIQNFSGTGKPKFSAKDDYSIVDAKVISIIDLETVSKLKTDTSNISIIERQQQQLLAHNDEILWKLKSLEQEYKKNNLHIAELNQSHEKTKQRLDQTRQTILSQENQLITYHAFPCPRCKSIVTDKGHVVIKPNGLKAYHCRPFW